MSFNLKEKLKSKKVIAVVLCVTLILGIIACDIILGLKKAEKTYIAMGTIVSAQIYGKDSKEAEAEIQESIIGIEEACLSWRIDGSDVQRINANSGDYVSVSADTAKWIASACKICEKSGGAFDISVGKVTQLWNIGSGKESLPEKDKLKEALKTVDFSNILCTPTQIKISEGQGIDMGAVGKGIACDRSFEILESYNIKSAIISVGGSVLVYGKKATVGIINPNDDSKHLGTIKLKNKFVSTSGDYERFFELNGKKYHHIIDPMTGYPADSNIKSVTVVSNSGLESDALSTACFVLGYKPSLELLSQFNAEAVFVLRDNSIAVTQGLKRDFKLTDNSFTVI